MAYTTPSTPVALSVLTAAYLISDVRDNVAWLATDSPACRVYSNVGITVTTSVWTSLTYNLERFDNANIHSTSVNTNRLTIPSGGAGKYLVGGGHAWVGSAAGDTRGARIGLNANPVAWQNMTNAVGHSDETAICTVMQAAVADYFNWDSFQNTGGNLQITPSIYYSPEFYCFWFRT